MAKLIAKGTTGALLEVCDTPTKYELVSAWGYDEKTNSWCQGHYFTLWNNITKANKQKLFEEAKKHFAKHYL